MTDSQEEDFLEVDPQVRGQNYCCISFVSPENILANKEIWKLNKFLGNMQTRYKNLEQIAKKHIPDTELANCLVPEFSHDFEKLQERYKDFLYVNNDSLESEFYEKNEFKTTVRGVKVRGSYDTLQEAQAKAKKLQQTDRNFNVYIGQVGYWLPWDPNPHSVENQEYAEPELNNLVKEYRKNQEKKDAHFAENLDYAKEQAEKQKKEKAEQQNKLENNDESTVSEENVVTEESTTSVVNSLEEADPWLKQKEES